MIFSPQKLLFFDYDGTLSYNYQSPSQRTVSALNKVQNAGYKIFLCTGRCKGFIPEIKDIKFDGVISAAGARVSIGDKILFETTLSKELLKKYLQLAYSKGLFGALEGPDNMILFGKSPKIDERLGEFKSINSTEDFFERFADEPINKFSLWGETNMDYLKEGKKDFFVVDHGHASEYIPLGCSKSNGMKRIADYYGQSIAETVGFGDSFNDLDMLKAAGIGVAMGNAIKEVKDSADVITDSVENDGVAVWIENNLF